MAVEIAAIVQAGERVDHRHFHGGMHALAQPFGVALAAHQRAHARDHLVAIHRPLEEIVHADLQAAQDAPLVAPSAIIRTETLRVRSSDRSWLHRRRPSKSSRSRLTITRS